MKSDSAGTNATNAQIEAATVKTGYPPARSKATALIWIIVPSKKKYQYSDLDDRPPKSPARLNAELTALPKSNAASTDLAGHAPKN